MQARLSLHRFPSRMAASFGALCAAVTLGGFIGYATKPATVITGATHTIVVPLQVPALTSVQVGPGGRLGGPLN
jgi:hypothetical protein